MDKYVLIELKEAITIPNASSPLEPVKVDRISSRSYIGMSGWILTFALDDVVQEAEDDIPESVRVKTLYLHAAEGDVRAEGEIKIPRENIVAIVQYCQQDLDGQPIWPLKK